MKKLLLIFFILPISCLNNSYKERGLSNDQIKLKLLVDRYSLKYNDLPNQMRKKQFRNSYPFKIGAYIRDSLNGVLKNCKVKMTELTITPIQDATAFYATFKDSMENVYWMEFDYKDFQKNDLYKNPAYLLLKNMPEGVDTVLSFLYNGKIKWNDEFSDYSNELKIQVVPYPKDYSFNSKR